MRFTILLIFAFLLLSCGEETVVKPSAQLRLEYPEGVYKRVDAPCHFSFLKNEYATLQPEKNCGATLVYPKMNAELFISYQKVNDTNLNSLLYDAQKLAYGHNIRANSIPEQPFVNPENNTYGMLYMINGDAASQSQFYLTDSINHFITGALYFEAKPNFDSIYPAVQYLRNDIRSLMETVEWQKP